MADKSKLEKIIYVGWEESEKGWGQRPDGCSLHLTEDDFKIFLGLYWDGMPDKAPSEYSRPTGKPVTAQVSPGLYKRVQENEYGLRLLNQETLELVGKKDLIYGIERSGWMPSARV